MRSPPTVVTAVVVILVLVGAVAAGGLVAWRLRFAGSSAVDGSGTVHLSRAADRVERPGILGPMATAPDPTTEAAVPDPTTDPTPEGGRP